MYQSSRTSQIEASRLLKLVRKVTVGQTLNISERSEKIERSIIELLSRAGTGSNEVVDPDLMRPENISRHPLGIQSNGSYKANEFCQRLNNSVPGVTITPHIMTAQSWLEGSVANVHGLGLVG